jgi:hypothetical protein
MCLFFGTLRPTQKHTFCRKTNFQTFLAYIELALKTLESADDITAAETAPRPKNETAAGVKYCKTSGKTSFEFFAEISENP